VTLRLGDVMTPDPLTAPPGTPLSEAAAVMRERSVGSVIVADDSGVVGILTERDLVRAAADGAHPTDATVDRWMTPSPMTMPPDGDITHALDQMIERHFRHIPICEGKRLVGVVSFRQLIEAAKIRKVDPWQPGTGKGLENFTVAVTPRVKDGDGWRDGETSFYRCTAWRSLAENLAESLTKGARVLVQGRLQQRSWETPEGERRSVVEVQVEEAGPSLRWATASITRTGAKAAAGASKGGQLNDEPPF
jgi:single-strand DNA-binding protein